MKSYTLQNSVRERRNPNAVELAAAVGRNKPVLSEVERPVPAGVSGDLTGRMPETVVARPYSGLHQTLNSTALRPNLGSRDGGDCKRPCNLDSGGPCRNDGFFQQYWELGRGEWQGPKSMRGMTLIELAVVLLILVALAGVTLMMTQNIPRNAECVATDTTLANIREAIMGGAGQAGYRSDMGGGPNPDNKTTTPTAITLNALFNNPTNLSNPQKQTFISVTQRGWRGPYITGGITCNTIFNAVQNHIVQGYALSYDIDKEQLCNLPTPATWTSASTWASATASVNGPTVALDSFPVIATNSAGSVATILQGSPIVLMKDAFTNPDGTKGPANGKYFLVSGGPAGGIETTPTNVENRLHPGPGGAHIDDRVLYLDSYDPDPNGNNPCSN